MSWDENFMGCSITAKGYRSAINDFVGVFFGIYRTWYMTRRRAHKKIKCSKCLHYQFAKRDASS